MHIVNVMFSRGLGGIEQSFVDYCEALQLAGHKVSVIISPDAKIRQHIPSGINITGVKNCGGWDIFAKSYIKKILKQINPDAVIVHGNRAVSLLKNPAKALNLPVVGITHNYSIKKLIGLDAVFATTEDLKNKVIEAGQPVSRVFKIPNMIRLENIARKNAAKNDIPVIGTMGRFVKKKGFDAFIRAIADLKNDGVKIKAIIGGSGEEEESLKSLAKELELGNIIEFSGWVSDKNEFFSKLDIFCLPSLHEPFGIILLEAFASGLPVITTDSEGPSEIAKNNYDALIIPKGDNRKMADAISALINDDSLRGKISQNAYETVREYSLEKMAVRISDALKSIKVN